MLYVLLAFFIVSFSGSTDAMQPLPQHPLERLNYVDAFDQSTIHQQFRNHLSRLGCNANVFGTGERQAERGAASSDDMDGNLDPAYVNACLEKLQSARNYAIMKPAYESGAFFLLQIVTFFCLVNLLGLNKDSGGGSIGAFTAIMSAMTSLHDGIRAGYNLYYPPAQALDSLERSFATNQCFIPKELWPIITEKFMTARQNAFQQRESMNFLEFALGLTIYKPHPMKPVQGSTAESITRSLHARVDFFFKDYETGDGKQSGWYLKINIHKFIHSLLNRDGQAPRYLCLHGPGGIGKTHFVNDLCRWIEELMANSVHFENLVISSAEELEGSAQRPGAFLRIVHNQLAANKGGSLVMFDEATWLNRDDMVSPAKRTFNGDLAKVSTSYFGNGIDGTGIAFELPPMLTFFALNADIPDPALKSRFDFIEFPFPTETALYSHAERIANASGVLQYVDIKPNTKKLLSWIQSLSGEDRNFRFIAANVEKILLTT